MNKNEKAVRSLVKAVSWRIIASIATIVLVFLATKNISISLGVGAVEIVTKFFLYYFHERIWNIVSWGKKEVCPVSTNNIEVNKYEK